MIWNLNKRKPSNNAPLLTIEFLAEIAFQREMLKRKHAVKTLEGVTRPIDTQKGSRASQEREEHRQAIELKIRGNQASHC